MHGATRTRQRGSVRVRARTARRRRWAAASSTSAAAAPSPAGSGTRATSKSAWTGSPGKGPRGPEAGWGVHARARAGAAGSLQLAGRSRGQLEATVPPSTSNTLPVTHAPAGEQR